MILTEMRDYIARHGRVAVTDLAVRFGAEVEALRGMLAMLERRGDVRRLREGTACGDCTRCPPGTREIIEWTGR